jgi:putative salt-induced outer membrane protein YdiY
MATYRVIPGALLVLAPAIGAWSADAPPPPQDVWIGKGQVGFLSSRGNSDAESLNGAIDLLRYDGPWKNEFNITGLYGKN